MNNKKIWFITGAGRGLGVDLVKAALAAGHAVVATGRDPAKVAAAIGEHADLLCLKLDVTVKGLFFPPTLIADLGADDPLVFEEQFGPALPIIKYSDLEDAIAQANDSPNGLGGSVWSKDIAKAKAIASRLECGSVWINKHGAIQPNAPFGGVKSSGCGVEFGEEGLAEYTDIQVVFN